MELSYKNKLLIENKKLQLELFTNPEFAIELYYKLKNDYEVKLAYSLVYDLNNVEKKIYYLVKKENNGIVFVFNKNYTSFKYLLESFNLKTQDNCFPNIIEDISSIKINQEKEKLAEEILKNFYIPQKEFIIEDKDNEKYICKIIKNSDLSITGECIVDEVILKKNNKKIGYLKAKYTTKEQVKLNKLDIKSEIVQFFLNKATIDYSKIENDFKNKGLGYQMYFHMSQHLTDNDITFRQSTICSEEAQRLWNKLEEKLKPYVKEKTIQDSYKSHSVKFLKIPQNLKIEFENKNLKVLKF